LSNITATVRARATLEQSTEPTIYNVSVLLSATEYSQALSPSTKKFMIRVRGNSKLQLAFVATDSSTNFITIPQGVSYSEDGLSFSGTLFFQTEKPTQTVEILEWT
jgi:hypothetical protein